MSSRIALLCLSLRYTARHGQHPLLYINLGGWKESNRAVWFAMPPILAPLPRRLSAKYSPLVCPSDLLPAVKHSKPRGVPLRVDVNYVKPAVLLDPPSIILNIDDAMEHSTWVFIFPC